MASPPFTPNTAIPGDTDIVSQFPGVDRTHIGIFNSWLLVNHNTYGRHFQVDIDQVGTTYGPSVTPPSVANVSTIFRDTDGGMKILRGDDSTVEWLGNPPGTIIDYAGSSIPTGYLITDGRAVSRSTYARLYTAVGTTWGSGDGSTTFNLPDLRGRVTAGVDVQLGTRIAFSATLGAVGGVLNTTIAVANLPNYTLNGTVASHTHQLGNDTVILSGAAMGNPGGTPTAQFPSITTYAQANPYGGLNVSFAAPACSVSSGGSGTPMPQAQSTAIVYKLIKY